MACKHDRIIQIFCKVNDLALLKIPHLNIEHEGYIPSIGILDGEIEFAICMDCGHIQGWEPITDRMVEDNEVLMEALAEERREAKRLAARAAEKPEPEITLASAYVRRVTQLLVSAFGKNWHVEAEAKDILTNELNNYEPSQSEYAALAQMLARCS